LQINTLHTSFSSIYNQFIYTLCFYQLNFSEYPLNSKQQVAINYVSYNAISR